MKLLNIPVLPVEQRRQVSESAIAKGASATDEGIAQHGD